MEENPVALALDSPLEAAVPRYNFHAGHLACVVIAVG